MIIYTAIIGKPEPLYTPARPGGHRFLCFTDLPISCPGWEIRRICVSKESDPRKEARYLKTHPHALFPDQSETVWIDANMRLDCDPTEIPRRAGSSSLVGLVHPKNDDLHQEATQINASLKIPMELLDGMIARYQANGFQLPNLVTSTGFLFRRATPGTIRFNELWWNEILVCVRDQMSVDYCAWKAGIEMCHFDGHFRNNDFFQYFTHEGKQAILRPRNLTKKFGRKFL